MNFFGDLIDLVLPEHCAGCGGPAGLLCDACAAPLRAPARPAGTTPPGLPPPWTVAPYEGPLRTILAAYKEHARTSLATPLGEALAKAVHATLAPHLAPDPRHPAPDPPRPGLERSRPGAEPRRRGPDPGGGRPAHRGHDPPAGEVVMVVWVPSRRRALSRRGHDALRGLVDVAVRRLRAENMPVAGAAALRQRGRTADQAALTAAQRTDNLRGALEVVPRAGVGGRRVVLVDDVVTTGASLAEAARVLRAAGADPLGAATIAATPRRHP